MIERTQPQEPDDPKLLIRTMVRGAYDIQKLRIQMGNRITANFKVKLGQLPGNKEADLDKVKKYVLIKLRADFKRLTSGVIELGSPKSGAGIISDQAEYDLVRQYLDLEKLEDSHYRDIEQALRQVPIYDAFLRTVKGIGPRLAGVIVSEIDIGRARYPSSLWKYAGLDVAADGRGRSRRREHLVKMAYRNKEGEETERDSITFNPFLKTKLLGVLGPSFLKQGRGHPYAHIYYDYRHRLDSRPDLAEASKGRKKNMAMRYMVKRFLADLYVHWRTLEGLPLAEEYSAAKLGLRHQETEAA